MAIGDARDWPTVDPSELRSKSDCRTWEDLDYWISARASMMRLQAAFAGDDHRRDVGYMVPSYYTTFTLRRESVTVVETRFIPPLRVAGTSHPYTFGRPRLAVSS